MDWLNELVFRVWGQGWAPVELRIGPANARTIKARLSGPRLSEGACRREVKAASYHGLSVARTRLGWRATVLLDL